MADSQSPMAGMSQTKTFVMGILAGFLVLCTIGFFVLLSMMLGDKDDSYMANNAGGNAAPTQVAPTPTQPTEISVSPVTDEDHVQGPKKAKLTLVEYSDFQCPYCERFEPTVSQVLEAYPDDVRVVYRHFPLRSIHPEAANAANAAECAAEQGKFWEYHDELFANQATLGSDRYAQIAKDLGLNVSKFSDCIASGKYETAVQADEASAAAAGAQGTPYSVLIGPNGETVPVNGAQPFSVVDAAIKSMLK